MVRILIPFLTAMLAAALVAVSTAQSDSTANVQVRVWQSAQDAEGLYISARPEGGSWNTLGTIPLDMSGLNSRGTYRYGDITVAVEIEGVAQPAPTPTPTPSESNGPAPPPDPAPAPEPFMVNVEIRVWQSTADAASLYISARHEGGRWDTLGTIPLDMSGLNSRGTFRYGDIALAVPVPGVEPRPETPTPTPTPWVDPRPDNTYTLAELAGMPAPAAPKPPLLPDHIMALQPGGSTSVDVHLVSASRVTVNLIHTYNSREYPVTCDSTRSRYVLCRYSENGPLNESGTARLSLFAATGAWPWRDGAYQFVSASLDESQLTCNERPGRTRYGDNATIWWCYDPATYAAWERARDAALQPATDPLERWLRAEAGPPLWYQDSPYSGEGNHTTGVMSIDPYVDYQVEITNDGEAMTIWARCAPVSPIDGSVSIRWDDLLSGFVNDGVLTLRRTYLCDWTIAADGKWRLEITPAE